LTVNEDGIVGFSVVPPAGTSFSIETLPTVGEVLTSPGGLFYRPFADRFGADRFVVVAVGGDGRRSAPVVVEVTILPQPDPIRISGSFFVTTPEDTAVEFGLTVTDVDLLEGQAVDVAIAVAPPLGRLELIQAPPSLRMRFTPTPDAFGQTTATLRFTSNEEVVERAITFSITPQPDPLVVECDGVAEILTPFAYQPTIINVDRRNLSFSCAADGVACDPATGAVSGTVAARFSGRPFPFTMRVRDTQTNLEILSQTCTIDVTPSPASHLVIDGADEPIVVAASSVGPPLVVRIVDDVGQTIPLDLPVTVGIGNATQTLVLQDGVGVTAPFTVPRGFTTVTVRADPFGAALAILVGEGPVLFPARRAGEPPVLVIERPGGGEMVGPDGVFAYHTDFEAFVAPVAGLPRRATHAVELPGGRLALANGLDIFIAERTPGGFALVQELRLPTDRFDSSPGVHGLFAWDIDGDGVEDDLVVTTGLGDLSPAGRVHITEQGGTWVAGLRQQQTQSNGNVLVPIQADADAQPEYLSLRRLSGTNTMTVLDDRLLQIGTVPVGVCSSEKSHGLIADVDGDGLTDIVATRTGLFRGRGGSAFEVQALPLIHNSSCARFLATDAGAPGLLAFGPDIERVTLATPITAEMGLLSAGLAPHGLVDADGDGTSDIVTVEGFVLLGVGPSFDPGSIDVTWPDVPLPRVAQLDDDAALELISVSTSLSGAATLLDDGVVRAGTPGAENGLAVDLDGDGRHEVLTLASGQSIHPVFGPILTVGCTLIEAFSQNDDIVALLRCTDGTVAVTRNNVEVWRAPAGSGNPVLLAGAAPAVAFFGPTSVSAFIGTVELRTIADGTSLATFECGRLSVTRVASLLAADVDGDGDDDLVCREGWRGAADGFLVFRPLAVDVRGAGPVTSAARDDLLGARTLASVDSAGQPTVTRLLLGPEVLVADITGDAIEDIIVVHAGRLRIYPGSASGF
jgi:hypothetical protein